MSAKKRENQSIIVRGIAAAIQAMHMPTFDNLKEMLSKFGWKLIRDETNKQTNESDWQG